MWCQVLSQFNLSWVLTNQLYHSVAGVLLYKDQSLKAIIVDQHPSVTLVMNFHEKAVTLYFQNLCWVCEQVHD